MTENWVAWNRAKCAFSAFQLDHQMLLVGCSVRYDDRPRYWEIDGERVYASLDDYITDGLH